MGEYKGWPQTVDAAFSALGSLIGAVTLARAVSDQALADQITNAARQTLVPN